MLRPPVTEGLRTLVEGWARGPALVLDDPISLWGGLDPQTGVIVDAHHPQRGARVAGAVLFMPSGRGSSSTSSTFLEAVRLRTNPAALVLAEEDDILILAAVVARSLYGITVPVGLLGRSLYEVVRSGDDAAVEPRCLIVNRNGSAVLDTTTTVD
jgi:predicted aconitase with swiveling domain